MESYADRAQALFEQQHNCAQAVVGAFANALEMDEKTVMRAASSLGGGLGHAGEVCGAVLGMAMAVGLAKGYDDTPDAQTKAEHSARVRRLVEDFRAQWGATGCDELRVVGDRSVCTAFVRFAAEQAAREMAK